MAKVLLVEDDNNLREIYQARLQAEGYDIVSANDGEAALVVAKSEKPDLIISDVMMPKISGFEMLDILRNTEELRDTKVIMLTALGQAEDQSRADKLGADRYLVKSQVTLEDIVKVSHELLGDTAEAAAEPAAAPAAVTPVAEVPVAVPVAETAAVPVATPPAAEMPAPVPATPDIALASPPSEAASAVQPEPVAAAPSEPVAPVSGEPPVQSSADEEAAVTQQIEDFVAAQPTPAAEPTTQTAAATAGDEQILADAVNDLNSDTTALTEPAPTPPPSAPPLAPVESTAPAETGDGAVAHKKIIQPPTDTQKPDLDALLAAEEAKEQTAAEPIVGGPAAVPEDLPSGAPAPSPHEADTPPSQAGDGQIDPNSIAI